MLTSPDLLYRLISTGFDRTIRQVEDLNILRFCTARNPFCIDVNRRTLLISWPASENQTIESTERFAHALLHALQAAHLILDQRGQGDGAISKPGV